MVAIDTIKLLFKVFKEWISQLYLYDQVPKSYPAAMELPRFENTKEKALLLYFAG